MANRFELVETRLKYGCNTIFLIKGIYSENKKGANEIICCVDGKKMPMTQEVKEGVEVRQKYGWYTFQKMLRKKRNCQSWNCQKEKGKQFFRFQ